MADEFTPINVAKDRDELGRVVDPISEGVSEWADTSPREAGPATRPAAPQREVSPRNNGGTIQTSNEWATIEPSTSDEWADIAPEDGLYQNSLLPEGVMSQSYSPDDLVTNEALYEPVLAFMNERFGIQATEGESREDIVNKFLNSRRGVAMAGNSVRVLAETSHMADVMSSGDRDRQEVMARGYALYENMAGVTSDETSWGEFGEAALDVTREVLLDPINLASLVVGKVAGGVATKAGVRALETYVATEVRTQLAAGVSRAAVEANKRNIYRMATAAAKKEGGEEVAQFAAQMAATSGGRRIMSNAGLKEIGASALVDAVAGSGFEYLYQRQLVDAEVQSEVNPYSVGLAALGAIAMGGVSAGVVAARGTSNTALVSEVVGQGDSAKVAANMRADIAAHYDSVRNNGSSWASKVEAGTELEVQDTDFFVELLLGMPAEDGASPFGGLAKAMQEEGFYFVKKYDEDKVSNYIADFIESMDPEDIKAIVKTFEDSSGINLSGLRDVTDANGVTKTLDEVTPQSFSQAFATNMSNNARGLNAASQVAKRLGIKLGDLKIETFIDEALGLNLMKGDKVKKGGRVMGSIAAGQNRFIRTLVSHPSTSFLNVLGWTASSGMASLNDIVRGTLHMSRGAIEEVMGLSAKGATRKQVGAAMLKANANRVKLLLDPDMTAAAFKSALERNAGALDKLKNVQSGGVDVSASVDDVIKRTKVGQLAENYVNAAQTATFVHAQDTFTKSQEYIFQMDKALRVVFNKSYNDFYTGEGAGKIMASEEYLKIEKAAIDKVMEHTFSKSYKGKSVVGQFAGFIEDARNMPFVGMMVPFGRFFNNTVDFTLKNTLGVSSVLKYAGKYPDKSQGELAVQGMIAGGLVLSLTQNEQEKRRQGLGMYDSIDPTTGEIISQQYDYPLSLFIATARLISYAQEGEAPPMELVEQYGKDFAGGGLTRNLTTTSDLFLDAFVAVTQGEVDKALDKGGQAIASVGAQAIGGFTRPFEPVDTIVGLATGTEMRPQNIKDGNAFIGKSLTYVRNIHQVFSGEPFNDTLISSSEGERDIQLTKNVGIRVVRPTNALRLMNVLAYDSWENNAEYAASRLVAGASNEYNRMMFEEVDRIAEELMADPTFRNLSTEHQRGAWEEALGRIKDTAMFRISYEYTGPESTFALQLELVNGTSEDAIRQGMKELGYTGEIGDLNYDEITLLKSNIGMQADIDTYERPYRIKQ